MTDIELLTTKLVANEAIIERGLKTFVEVGTALTEIRDERQYRQTHSTFEDYCQERWGFDRRQANRMIEATEIVAGLGSIDPKPANIGQTRELAKVPEPERVEVWKETVERTGGKPTAAVVREVAKEVSQPPEKEPSTEIDTGTVLPISKPAELTTKATEPTAYEKFHAKTLTPKSTYLIARGFSLEWGEGRMKTIKQLTYGTDFSLLQIKQSGLNPLQLEMLTQIEKEDYPERIICRARSAGAAAHGYFWSTSALENRNHIWLQSAYNKTATHNVALRAKYNVDKFHIPQDLAILQLAEHGAQALRVQEKLTRPTASPELTKLFTSKYSLPLQKAADELNEFERFLDHSG